MDEIKKKKRKKRIILFSCLGAILIGVIALICYCSMSVDEIVSEGKVEKIERRTIATSVSGSGTITSVDNEEITSQQFGGKVKTVYVKEGQVVSPGQVICQFDTKDLQDRYNDVQKRIVETKNNKVDRDNEYNNNIAESRSDRNRRIAETTDKLQNARNEYLAAYVDLDNANKSYASYLSQPGHSEWDLQALQLQANIQSKKSTLDVKKATIDSYEDTLETLNDTNEDSLNDAKNTYDDSTEESIKTMEESLKEIQKSIGECTVRSTIGGTITNLNVKAGDSYRGGTICKVEGLNSLMVQAEVSEYDVPDIAAGMKVRIKTDATRDKELTGVVTYVSPSASSSGGSASAITSLIGMDASSIGGSSMSSGKSSATFLVKIALDEQNPRLRLGMNAKISIITNEIENALSVPYDSIIEEENGDKYVEIVTNMDEIEKDETISYDKKKVKVQVGIEGTYYAEVSGDGIVEGKYVYVPEATGDDSIEEIMNQMGASAGV